MLLGIATHTTDLMLQPVELARAVEDRGFESVFMPDHSHIPASRQSPWPGSITGEPLPHEYSRLHDPLIARAAASTATTTLRLGTCVALPAQRDAIQLAKEVATLDHLSGGRFIFGIGFGWNREEMADHGVEFSSRWDLVREKVLLMKALWTEDEASFHGDFVELPPSWAWPKPVQRPHPPILIGGGWGPKLLGAVCEWADGWMPVTSRGTLAGRIELLHEAAARVGRDPATIQISVTSASDDPAKLAGLEREGVTRAILAIPHGTPSDALRQLDAWAPLVDQVASDTDDRYVAAR